jgi:hypothetical protein
MLLRSVALLLSATHYRLPRRLLSETVPLHSLSAVMFDV